MKFDLIKISSKDQVKKIMKNINADDIGIELMINKTLNLSFLIYECDFYIANILKQEALASGIDACVSKDTITAKVTKTDCLVFGDVKKLYTLANKLTKQNFKDLRELGSKLKQQLDAYFGNFLWQVGEKTFDLTNNYLIMGILNVTPDSFYDGGKYDTVSKALFRCEQILNERVDIIDIGAISTRPFSQIVSVDEEKRRLLPVLEAIKKRFSDAILSVDTFNSSVAKEAFNYNVSIINDISGFTFDEKMSECILECDFSCVIMHIKDKPKTMQENPSYSHLITEINDFFDSAMQKLSKNNFDTKKIVLDPGIGFAKTTQHNLEIIKNIESFKIFGRPILIGLSRKSFIGNILNKDANERLFGTIGANVASYFHGARIFRVHDVAANKEALELVYQLNK
ncbi:Dihydropteroate synthase [Desulfurella amilsii]|uniref:dihydropteroate synthase n=1 Tax=Desulfurella amilsii TaxID=1562698 RepID=A0A1X4XVI9_9BACT|nr:dihydropteroate synthase [Desulfurella amilsii]OSS41552.1 Dihydropteroate synthase [Desulfurella amilsii]